MSNTERVNNIVEAATDSSQNILGDFDNAFFSILDNISNIENNMSASPLAELPLPPAPSLPPYLNSSHSFIQEYRDAIALSQPISSLQSRFSTENILLAPSEIVSQILHNNTSPRYSSIFSMFYPGNTLFSDETYHDYYDEDYGESSIMEESFTHEPVYRTVLSKKAVQKLKHEKYTSTCKNAKCPILHIDFEDGDDIIVLPCGHCYDPGAITQWLSMENANCPVCRESLKDVEIRKM